MNKFLYPLAASAVLLTGNLFAQEAGMSNTQNDATPTTSDCVQSVTDANRTLAFDGGVITQEFAACASGQLQGTTLAIKGAEANAWYMAELVDFRGNALDVVRFTSRDVVNDELSLPFSARVQAGKNYSIQVTAPEGKTLSLRYLHGPMGTLWNQGNPVRGELTCTLSILSRDLNEASAMRETRGDDAPQNRALEGQCKTQVVGHDNYVKLNGFGSTVSQTFTACSKGVMDHLSVAIHTSFEDLKGRFFLKNAEGETLYAQEIRSRNIENGVLNLPLDIRVNEGDQLMFGIKTLENKRLLIHTNSQGREGVCKRNGATIEGNLEFTAYIEEADETPARAQLQDAKITTFPNPFSDRISVRLENAADGKAIIQLLDFSGNVLRSDLVFVKNQEGEITFETRDIDRPGYYALRVIQGDNVKNITIMKR